jgi:hypothetical protein
VERSRTTRVPVLRTLFSVSSTSTAELTSCLEVFWATVRLLFRPSYCKNVTNSRLLPVAGRIPSLDSLASLYLHPTATRPALLSSASALASSLTDSSSSLASYYIKIFTKYQDLAEDSVEDAKAWVENERVRLGKIASKKGQVAAKKIDEARMKQNVRSLFSYPPLFS